MMKTLRLAALLALAALGSARADSLLITGAGATFPFPLYSKWFSDYNKLKPELRFNYQSIGSGGGIQQITARTVDFGASDAPLTDEELAKAPGLQHVPTVLGAVVVTYQAPVADLRLTPETLAALFLGEITRWNDPRLAKDNPGAKLPDVPVTIVHRSDGSGTTAIFTDYLAKVSPAWKSKVGAGKSVKWPAGLGAKGNEGVTGLVKQTPGALGYVELAYATQNKLAMASLKNHDGHFVRPSLAATSAAAAGVDVPPDYRVSITDARGADAYPIASFTYLLVYRDQQDKAKGEALVHFLWWAVHDGQHTAPGLDYAPLPKPVVAQLEKTLASITVQGKPVSLATSR
ncbi:phosphate ABC transporter substrate-binding protein PstS [Anaeromyxobacter diazotrophicus]|uniref:Phosphate-binding protein n=1 Tax=Anaeromyxobacter diazotrophicus TaxID=2590199 RepID=A0A7I9VHF9_9BACT|nr:phosphate ABC transporter substrate-binding protein PstS [Anaeromyxobacter diazotrophicus]GEJ55833.1 phosphate-binding protein [Anaeromyxobacter diazotrophicus]